MKIELLGTGAIYTKYNSASILVNEEMLIDSPNGALKQLLRREYNPLNISKILITHTHGDHIADIPFILMYLYKLNKVERKTYIMGPVGIIKTIQDIFSAYNFTFLGQISEHVEFIELEPGKVLESKEIGYKLETVLVKHSERIIAHGYIIDDKLGITGDSGLCNSVEKIVNESKITVADCSNINGTEFHMGINDLKYLSEKYTKLIIPTHLKDATREELKKLNLSNIPEKEDGYQFEI